MTTRPTTNKCEILSSIDITSTVAVYHQIENQIQFAIASGRLGPGERLPSVRELSERLAVNPNTVAKAYRDLEVLGLLYTRRGMGVFVSKGIESKCREACRRQVLSRLHEVVAEGRAAGMGLQEVAGIVKKCYAAHDGPSGAAPSSVKAKTGGRR